MEDGTEIVINPCALDPKESLFSLEEEFVIDLEDESIASLGLTDIWGFDVDSEGSIYLFKPPWAKGESPKARRLDVFNPDGVFRGTVSLEAHVDDPFFTRGGPLTRG